MSYDIYLVHPVTKERLELDAPHQMKGGTYRVGGTNMAHLNVTYNYCPIFRRLLGEKGIRAIYGMTGAWSIHVLQEAIALLGDAQPTGDYWEVADGNAKMVLLQLVALAQLRPDGVWAGD